MPEAELQKSNIASQGAGEIKQAQQPAQAKDYIPIVIRIRWFQCHPWLYARCRQPEPGTQSS